MYSANEIYEFLIKIDDSFPIPLSEKVNLKEYSIKLSTQATILTKKNDENIVALVAGYTKNLINNSAYICVVGVLENYRGRGFAAQLVNEFIELCKKKNILSVNLYTHKTNNNAIKLYKKIGFNIMDNNIDRPCDLHLVYEIK